VKIGDLVKVTPLAKWDMDPEDNTHIGVVTKLGFDARSNLRDPAKVILLNFGDDDGIFRIDDWRFEVISENR
jgi:hypothetical protein